LCLLFINASVGAVPLKGFEAISRTGLVTMIEGPSPLESGTRLEEIPDEIGWNPVVDGPTRSYDQSIDVPGGAIGALFAPYDSTIVLNDNGVDWERSAQTDRDAPLRFVDDAEIDPGENLFLVCLECLGDIGTPELDGLKYAVSGALDGLPGGALSLFYNRPQTQTGFTAIDLAPGQTSRFILVDFYGLDGKVIDALTIKIPPWGPTGRGTGMLSFTALAPFHGITITSNDPGGLGIGDFRFVVSAPSAASLLLSGLVQLLMISAASCLSHGRARLAFPRRRCAVSHTLTIDRLRFRGRNCGRNSPTRG
jgi:hypothetical protein